MRAAVLILFSALTLSGCITARKQEEVYSAISDIGFLEADARCISQSAGRQLSVRELRSLQRASREITRSDRQPTLGQVIDAISEHVEPETLGTVTSLAADCISKRTRSAQSPS